MLRGISKQQQNPTLILSVFDRQSSFPLFFSSFFFLSLFFFSSCLIHFGHNRLKIQLKIKSTRHPLMPCYEVFAFEQEH